MISTGYPEVEYAIRAREKHYLLLWYILISNILRVRFGYKRVDGQRGEQR